MSLSIFNNIISLNAQRIFSTNSDRLATSTERIASGIRINRGADDAAGLAISEALRSDIRALRQGLRNANDGISLINVVEGALNEQTGLLVRLRELSSQAATGTVGSTERATIQLEFKALVAELDRIADTSEFNGQKLLDGSLAKDPTLRPTITTVINGISQQIPHPDLIIQIGIDATDQSRINLNDEINLTAIKSDVLTAHLDPNEAAAQLALTTGAASGTTTFTDPDTGLTRPSIDVHLSPLNVLTADDALVALLTINDFIAQITEARGKVGAVQNRLVSAISNQGITIENLTQAESAIRDSDIAAETADLTRNQILVQASIAMVGQANLIPQSVLQLLS